MGADTIQASRRAFFLRGGAVLGAGAAVSVGAGAATTGDTALAQHMEGLRQRLAGLEDREAIRQIHLAFTAMVESGDAAAAAELFDDHAELRLGSTGAVGKPAIRDLLCAQAGDAQGGVVHGAYRHGAAHAGDVIMLDAQGSSASATFHVEARLCTPLAGDCTAAQMARLQGNVATSRWESGRFDARYVKTQGHWKLSSLHYRAA